jgi:hypothetical protein
MTIAFGAIKIAARTIEQLNSKIDRIDGNRNSKRVIRMPIKSSTERAESSSTLRKEGLLLALVWLAALSAVFAGVPGPVSPFPWVLMFQLASGAPAWLATAMAPVSLAALLLWARTGRRTLNVELGIRRYGVRTLALASLAYFVVSAHEGAQRYGGFHLIVVAAENVAWLSLTEACLKKFANGRVRLSLVDFLLVSWLFRAAFPFLGEAI